MLKSSPDPNLISLSTSLYRVLLAFYPVGFKRDYGPHMVQVFRDCCLKVYRQSGPTGMLSLWALTLFDWLKTVIEEQIHKETEMTREKFIRLSGWGMIVAAITIPLSFFVNSSTIQLGIRLVRLSVSTEEYNVIRTFAGAVGGVLLFVGVLLLMAGTAGLRLRYGRQSGSLGNNSLLGAFISGGIVLVGIIGSALFNWEGWWFVLWIAMAIHFAFLAIFGVATMRTKPMQRWNWLPLLAGVWLPLFTLLVWVYEITTGNAGEPPEWFANTMILITVGGLVLLGYVLQSDAKVEEAVA